MVPIPFLPMLSFSLQTYSSQENKMAFILPSKPHPDPMVLVVLDRVLICQEKITVRYYYHRLFKDSIQSIIMRTPNMIMDIQLTVMKNIL
jgi:hypothetical protein